MTKDRAIANLIELKEALGDKFELKVVNNEELKDSLQFAIEQLDKVEKYKDKWTAVFDDSFEITETPYNAVHYPPSFNYYHKDCKSNKYEVYMKKYRFCPACGERMIFGDDGSDS